MRAVAIALVLVACRRAEPAATCEAPHARPRPAALDARGPYAVGARTIVLASRSTEVWYPAVVGNEPHVRYDLRRAMPRAEADKIPDADNPWLACDCAANAPVDEAHGPYPVVLFLHGAGSVGVPTHWASRGYIVIAPDIPGIGLAALLGGEPQAFPLLFPAQVLDAILKPSADHDELAFVREAIAPRIAIVGHSLGAVLARSIEARPEVALRIALAGARPNVSPMLTIAGETDGIAPPSGERAVAPDRAAIVRGAGHLAFTDLCALDTLGVARRHGIPVPEMIATLAIDGCRPTDAPFATTSPVIRALTAGAIEETLSCDRNATKALAALRDDPRVELSP